MNCKHEYKIGDVIEAPNSTKYHMVYVVIKKNKAVYVPYIGDVFDPIEPLNEKNLSIFKKYC